MLVNIIAGPKYVGKTKFAESKSGFKIFEDEVIESLTSDDYTPTDEQVFVAKMRLVEEALKAGHKKIWVVGKHLTRNERIKMYRHIKEVDSSVVVNVTILHQTFTMLCQEMLSIKYNPGTRNVIERFNYYFGDMDQINASMDDMKVIKSEYTQYAPAREGVDCDTFNVVAPNFKFYKYEFEDGIDNSHNSPYHKETIREHINMTIDAAKQYPEYPELPEIAAFHDLGKTISRSTVHKKTFANLFFNNVNGGQFDHFINHENVSAMYYLIKNKHSLTQKVLDNAEVIYQHMHAKTGFKSKYIRKHNLSPRIVELATFFNENCDTKARVVDEKVLEVYQLLQQFNGEPHVQLALDDLGNYKISMSADYEEFSIIPKNDPSWLIAFDLDDLRRNAK